MFTHLLVPIDGSDHAGRAVDIACDLAQRYHAKLTLMHVINGTGHRAPEALQAYAASEHLELTEADLADRPGNELLDKAQDRARTMGVPDSEIVLEHGDPATRIAGYARSRDVDLIVMGRRGLGDLGGLLRGSVSHKVEHDTDCGCLTVK